MNAAINGLMVPIAVRTPRGSRAPNWARVSKSRVSACITPCASPHISEDHFPSEPCWHWPRYPLSGFWSPDKKECRATGWLHLIEERTLVSIVLRSSNEFPDERLNLGSHPLHIGVVIREVREIRLPTVRR